MIQNDIQKTIQQYFQNEIYHKSATEEMFLARNKYLSLLKPEEENPVFDIEEANAIKKEEFYYRNFKGTVDRLDKILKTLFEEITDFFLVINYGKLKCNLSLKEADHHENENCYIVWMEDGILKRELSS